MCARSSKCPWCLEQRAGGVRVSKDLGAGEGVCTSPAFKGVSGQTSCSSAEPAHTTGAPAVTSVLDDRGFLWCQPWPRGVDRLTAGVGILATFSSAESVGSAGDICPIQGFAEGPLCPSGVRTGGSELSSGFLVYTGPV